MKGFRRFNGRPEKLYQLLQSQSTVPYSGDGRTVSAIALKFSITDADCYATTTTIRVAWANYE